MVLFKVLGKEILKRHFDVAKFDKTDHVVPWKVVKHYCIQIKPDISDNELMLVLAHLKSKRQIELATNSHGEKVIKANLVFIMYLAKFVLVDISCDLHT